MKRILRRILFFCILVGFLGFGAIVIYVRKFHFTLPRGNFWFQATYNTLPHLSHYSSKLSYYTGDTLSLYGSVFPAGEVQLKIFSALNPELIWIDSLIRFPQQNVNEKAAEQGLSWKSVFKIAIPDSLKDDWWVIQTTKKKKTFRSSFVLKPKNIFSPDSMLYVLPAITWNAYNTWGGKSLYSPKPFSHLSFNRPCPPSDPFMEKRMNNFPFFYQSPAHDIRILKAIQNQGFTSDVITDLDWALDSNIFSPYKTIVIGNHSEYWSMEMYISLNHFLNRAGSLILLSGNYGFWNADSIRTDFIYVKRDSSNLWRMKDEKLASIIGTSTSTNSAQTFGPYEINEPRDSIFSFCFSNSITFFGEESQSIDFGAGGEKAHSFSGLFLWKNRSSAGSGLEFDRVWSGTPKNWITIASGVNPASIGQGQVFPDPSIAWSRDGGAQMGYYIHPAGGIVFCAGSVTFPGCIGFDPVADCILSQVLKRATLQK